MIKLYGVPSCNKIRDAKAILENNHISYQFINIKKTPVSEAQLKDIVNQLGIEKVLNKKGLTYKKLGLNQMDLDDYQLFQWLYKKQGMIKRPLFQNNNQYFINSDEKKIVEFCKQ